MLRQVVADIRQEEARLRSWAADLTARETALALHEVRAPRFFFEIHLVG